MKHCDMPRDRVYDLPPAECTGELELLSERPGVWHYYCARCGRILERRDGHGARELWPREEEDLKLTWRREIRIRATSPLVRVLVVLKRRALARRGETQAAHEIEAQVMGDLAAGLRTLLKELVAEAEREARETEQKAEVA